MQKFIQSINKTDFVDHKSYLSGSFSDSFFASPTSPDEIINTVNIVSSMKSSNSEGVDGINFFFFVF